MTYQAKEPLLGVRDRSRSENGFVTIPAGSMITTTGEVQRSGFVDVVYDGRIVAVFMRDLQARADMAEAASHGK